MLPNNTKGTLSMAHARRRVSYVVPPPIDPVPRLQLPPFGASRLGSTGPLLVPSQIIVQSSEEEQAKRSADGRPRHRLGVASLAIDTSTLLYQRTAPEGILYTGGRDGLVMSWDLGTVMKRKVVGGQGRDGPVRRVTGRWEVMTGWADDYIDEEAEEGEERLGSDGDILGDVVPIHGHRRRPSRTDFLVPPNDQWEIDSDAFKPGNPSQFRQCAQMHTDWVNDLLLCNRNQTVVSASSDGTIKVWNPHSYPPSDPSTIGSHSDYVRCLAHSPMQNWIASGSFDRTIKLWDLNIASSHSSSPVPLATLSPPDASAPKASIYALAADPHGHTIASGSPERVIRLWDPRTGKRTGKLVGHTDNIRTILISDDLRYLLTGSTDASIKLWSLTSKRCLHTFTYHTDSVWSLFSSHPSLEVFYSGDKSGLVCKVDVENCADVSEGECILLCQDPGGRSKASSEGVNRIVAMDDNLLWTASSSSSVLRWRIPQRRSVRALAPTIDGESERLTTPESPIATMSRRCIPNVPDGSTPPRSVHEGITRPSTSASHRSARDPFLPTGHGSATGKEEEMTLYGIPYQSLIRLTSLNDPFAPYAFTKGREADVATLYSAASIVSVPRPTGIRLSNPIQPSPSSQIRGHRVDDVVNHFKIARAEYEECELAADAIPFCSTPDDVIEGEHGLVRSIILNDRIHALTVDTAGEVAVWDIVRAVCRGKYSPEEVACASQRGSVLGGSDRDMERSPREALDAVRERIEGEAVVMPWSSVDTKTGVLTIHLNERCFEAEIYADEVGIPHDRHFNDETRLNIGKWVLRNIFLGFIREEQRKGRKRELRSNSTSSSPTTPRRDDPPGLFEINGKQPKIRSSSSSELSRHSARPSGSSIVISSPKMIPAVAQPVLPSDQSPSTPVTTTVRKVNLISLATAPPQDNATPRPPRPQAIDTGQQVTTPPTTGRDGDYFPSQSHPPTTPAMQAGTLPLTDDPSGLKSDPGLTPTLMTPGGLMGRLKNLGKISSKKPPEPGTNPIITSGTQPPEIPSIPEESSPPEPAVIKTPQQVLLSGPLSYPPSSEAPVYHLPPNVCITISEEAYPGWNIVYRGMVTGTAYDMDILEEVLPMWLLEYLFLNKTLPVSVVKISFVLLPWPIKDPGEEPLPELLDVTQSKLTASRFLRIRKVLAHVQDKLEKIARTTERSGMPRSSSLLDLASSTKTSRARPEDLFEILCNDILLPLDMTLAAVRQFVWRQSGELTMYYRRKTVQA